MDVICNTSAFVWLCVWACSSIRSSLMLLAPRQRLSSFAFHRLSGFAFGRVVRTSLTRFAARHRLSGCLVRKTLT